MAIRAAGSTDRRRIRDALERLGPYDGLVQRYPVPFTPDRHEALSARNIFFARYNASDELIPIRAPSPARPAP
jgi:branched-chain amino acid transport system substrate-binding protein